MKLTLNELNKRVEDANGGSLWLDSLKSIPEGFNPTVGGDLLLASLKSIPEGFNPTVGGDLWLDSLKSIPEGFNPTVGGSLELRGLTSIPEGFNPTVGGDLGLDSLKSIPEGFNPTVGGSLGLEFRHGKFTKLHNGDYVEGRYLYADGILTHIKRKVALSGGFTLYIGKINGRNVVCDGKNYAHCNKLREGIADLLFKSAKDRGSAQYKGMSLDTEVTPEEAVTMYRIITGACRQGSERFVQSLGKLKEKYTIREIAEITKGQYNASAFTAFFGL